MAILELKVAPGRFGINEQHVHWARCLLMHRPPTDLSAEVVPVNVSVKQPYFVEAMRMATEADVIIVMMHIGPTQAEYTAVCGS